MTLIADVPDWINPSQGLAVYTPLVDGTLIVAAGDTGILLLSPYTSLVVWSPTPLTTGHAIDVEDVDTAQFLFRLTTPADPIGNTLAPIQFPISSRALRLHNSSASTVEMHVVATTRATPVTFQGQQTPDVQDLSLPAQALAGTITLGYGFGGGQVFSQFSISGNIVKGVWQCLSGPVPMRIGDTVESHVDPGGSQTLSRLWVAPRGAWILQFVVTTAGNASLTTRHAYVG